MPTFLIGVGSSIVAFIFIIVFRRLQILSGNLPSWTLLFENDENGNEIRGSIDKLIEAVGKAHPIKVKIYPNGEFKNTERFDIMEAQLLFVENEADNKLVTASNIDHISMRRKPMGDREHQDEAYHFYVLASTRGKYFTSRYFIDGKEHYSKSLKRHMVWYGLIPP